MQSRLRPAAIRCSSNVELSEFTNKRRKYCTHPKQGGKMIPKFNVLTNSYRVWRTIINTYSGSWSNPAGSLGILPQSIPGTDPVAHVHNARLCTYVNLPRAIRDLYATGIGMFTCMLERLTTPVGVGKRVEVTGAAVYADSIIKQSPRQKLNDWLGVDRFLASHYTYAWYFGVSYLPLTLGAEP